jgi:hypothetical protein
MVAAVETVETHLTVAVVTMVGAPAAVPETEFSAIFRFLLVRSSDFIRVVVVQPVGKTQIKPAPAELALLVLPITAAPVLQELETTLVVLAVAVVPRQFSRSTQPFHS